MIEVKRKDEFDPIDRLSRGEICLANFIPPMNGASLGSTFFMQA
jgi:hypothetical protein